MIAPDTVIGERYRVVRLLGGGGMKMVYLAEDLRLGSRHCAFAEMVDAFNNADAQQQAVAAFQREADMLAQLSNEHIPRVYDRFSESNHHYLVMEFVDGITLEEEIKRNGGKLGPNVVIDTAIQILDTLEYLHRLVPPVIYRDLKPSNVMLTAGEQVKLIDFGIARFFAPLTNATMIGTQGYAPPEQYRGKVEARSDLYALGATMHHALSGRDPASEPPFSFPPLRKIAPDIDSGLAAIVDHALAYEVSRRITDAKEFKRRLIELSNSARSAAASRSAPAVTLRTQLQLPLGSDSTPATPTASKPSAAPIALSSAPTVVTTNPEIRCPSCARTIPADSRFCSYCASSLSDASGNGGPTAATVILSPASAVPIEERPEPSNSQQTPRRLKILRLPLIVALIFIATFTAVRLMTRQDIDSAPPAPPGSDVRVDPGSAPLSPTTRLQLLGLQQLLSASGYDSVRLQISDNRLVLKGTVPSEDDRATVRRLSMTLGFDTFVDELSIAPDPNAEG